MSIYLKVLLKTPCRQNNNPISFMISRAQSTTACLQKLATKTSIINDSMVVKSGINLLCLQLSENNRHPVFIPGKSFLYTPSHIWRYVSSHVFMNPCVRSYPDAIKRTGLHHHRPLLPRRTPLSVTFMGILLKCACVCVCVCDFVATSVTVD